MSLKFVEPDLDPVPLSYGRYPFTVKNAAIVVTAPHLFAVLALVS